MSFMYRRQFQCPTTFSYSRGCYHVATPGRRPADGVAGVATLPLRLPASAKTHVKQKGRQKLRHFAAVLHGSCNLYQDDVTVFEKLSHPVMGTANLQTSRRLPRLWQLSCLKSPAPARNVQFQGKTWPQILNLKRRRLYWNVFSKFLIYLYLAYICSFAVSRRVCFPVRRTSLMCNVHCTYSCVVYLMWGYGKWMEYWTCDIGLCRFRYWEHCDLGYWFTEIVVVITR